MVWENYSEYGWNTLYMSNELKTRLRPVKQSYSHGMGKNFWIRVIYPVYEQWAKNSTQAPKKVIYPWWYICSIHQSNRPLQKGLKTLVVKGHWYRDSRCKYKKGEGRFWKTKQSNQRLNQAPPYMLKPTRGHGLAAKLLRCLSKMPHKWA